MRTAVYEERDCNRLGLSSGMVRMDAGGRYTAVRVLRDNLSREPVIRPSLATLLSLSSALRAEE